MKLPSQVTIYEVGPRDGLQNEAHNVPTADKIRFIDALVASGIRAIEITSFVSPKWIPQLADAAEVARGVQRTPGVRMSALVPNRRGLDTALAAGIKDLELLISSCL
jgi:hydroxymethylglutaryl-CoA lyase